MPFIPYVQATQFVFIPYTDVREIVGSQPIGSFCGQDNQDVSFCVVFMYPKDAIICVQKWAILVL
jgi:hypothetical protein